MRWRGDRGLSGGPRGVIRVLTRRSDGGREGNSTWAVRGDNVVRLVLDVWPQNRVVVLSHQVWGTFLQPRWETYRDRAHVDVSFHFSGMKTHESDNKAGRWSHVFIFLKKLRNLTPGLPCSAFPPAAHKPPVLCVRVLTRVWRPSCCSPCHRSLCLHWDPQWLVTLHVLCCCPPISHPVTQAFVSSVHPFPMWGAL